MRHIQLTLVAIFALATTALAQQKASEKAVIKTPTVQCEECKGRIEKYLSHQDGITSVKVDFKKKTTTVTWLTDRTNLEAIKTAIANSGYDADDVTAEESAYNKLPKCCKKPAKE
ncbi:MAG: heavy-metal-associated domain-containing protein [Bacteroidetes bacterium]|nr:heavy-metal-associated domain-containing protein [Bacteroidota bacterium]